MELWADKKIVGRIIGTLCIIAAILGVILGSSGLINLGLDNEILDRAVSALVLAIVLSASTALCVSIPTFFVLTLIQGIRHWLKVRQAKTEAYYMIGHSMIDDSKKFQEIILELKRSGDREATHLLYDLHELEKKQELNKNDG